MTNETNFTEDKAKATPAGGVLIGKREGQTIIHDEGTLGGYLVGQLHKENGIKAINKSTGQPLEMQGGEIVITAPAVSDNTKREFDGKMMTNREILSKINSEGGGVSFADGGDIPVKINVSDKKHFFKGKKVDDIEIAQHLGYNSSLKNGGQLFSYKDQSYDIDKAYDLLYKNKLAFTVKEVKPFAMKYPIYDKSYKAKADMDYGEPFGIMIKTQKGEDVLIDGNHRMNEAYKLKLPAVKVYYISAPNAISKFSTKISFELGGNTTEFLAPNGKPSNLTALQYNLVRTPEFKAWFGDWEKSPEQASKVVDENGEPLVVYHGTNYHFTQFNENRKAHYFAVDKKYADFVIENYRGKNHFSKIIPCFLNIKKLQKVKFPIESNNVAFYLNEHESLKEINGGLYGLDDLEQKHLKQIKEKDINTYVYVCFNPNQIKLADGTNTTFEARDNDIRYDDGGMLPENEEIYKKWQSLVNMTKSELKKFYNSPEGKKAGLSASEAKAKGIDSGRESSRWIMKMKDTPVADWTDNMWKWAKKQISFISRMSGNKGGLYDGKGNKTRKHTSLLIWGHNPEKNTLEKGGHLSAGKSIEDIAQLHDVSVEHINNQIQLGLKVEREHTSDTDEQLQIAKDHLVENPDYYTILDTAGLEDGVNLESKSKYVKYFYATENPSIDLLLKKTQPLINELIVKQKALYLKHFEKPMSNWEVEMYEIGLIFKMVNALNQYLKSTDLITNFTLTRQQGKFEIQATVKRDDKPYSFYTELIPAGGHNIQEFHYRYITKTDLPSSSENNAVENLKAKISTIKKINTIDGDSDRIKNNIKRYYNQLEQGFEMMNGREYPLSDSRISFIKNRIKSDEKEIDKLNQKKSDLESVFEALKADSNGATFGKKVKEAIGRKILDRLYAKQYKETGDALTFKTETQSITEPIAENRVKILAEFNTISVTKSDNDNVNLEIGFDFRKKYSVIAEFKNISINEIAIKINDVSKNKFLRQLISIGSLLVDNDGMDYHEKIYKILKLDNKQFEIAVFENGKEKNSWLLPIKNLSDFRLANQEEIEFYDNSKSTSTSEFKNGGKIEKEDLVKDAKDGNSPSRDLNNYNDLLDVQADGAVGGDSGIYEKGGNLDFLNGIDQAFAEGGTIGGEKVNYIKINKIYTKNSYQELLNQTFLNYIDFADALEKAFKDYGKTQSAVGFTVNEKKEPLALQFKDGKNTVLNFNPITGTYNDFEKQLIRRTPRKYRVFDWMDFYHNNNRRGAPAPTTPEPSSTSSVKERVEFVNVSFDEDGVQTMNNYSDGEKLYKKLIALSFENPNAKIKVFINPHTINGAFGEKYFYISKEDVPFNPSLDITKFTLARFKDYLNVLFGGILDWNSLFLVDEPKSSSDKTVVSSVKPKNATGVLEKYKGFIFENVSQIYYAIKNNSDEITDDDWMLFSIMGNNENLFKIDFTNQELSSTSTGISIYDNFSVFRTKFKDAIFGFSQFNWNNFLYPDAPDTSNTEPKTPDTTATDLAFRVVIGYTEHDTVKHQIIKCDNINELFNKLQEIYMFQGTTVLACIVNMKNPENKQDFRIDLINPATRRHEINMKMATIDELKGLLIDNTVNVNWTQFFAEAGVKTTSTANEKMLDDIYFFIHKYLLDVIDGEQNFPQKDEFVADIVNEDTGSGYEFVINETKKTLQAKNFKSNKLLFELGFLVDKPKVFIRNFAMERKFLTQIISDNAKEMDLKRPMLSNEELGFYQREINAKILRLRQVANDEKEQTSPSERIKAVYSVKWGDYNKQYPETNLIAINGSKSELTEEEYFTVRTPEFKAWFGDWEKAYLENSYSGVSKLINPRTKEPQPVFHGTNVLFTEWKTYATNNAHYFAVKREMSDYFASTWENRGDKAGVDSKVLKNLNPNKGKFLYRCFLDVKNPIDFSHFGVEKRPIKEFLLFLKINYNVSDYDFWTNIGKSSGLANESLVYAWQIIRLWQNFTMYIKTYTTYDGYIFYEYIPDRAFGGLENASLSFCAFESNQIKFSDAYEFNALSNDSRFNLGGEIQL